MPRKYEALFIFAGNVKDESLDKVIEQSTTEIEKLGGIIEKTDALGRRTFARTMQKHDHGVYVKIRFAIDPVQVGKIHSRFQHNEDCFRMQIVTRSERVESAKFADNARRALFKASLEAAGEVPSNKTRPSYGEDRDRDRDRGDRGDRGRNS